MRTDDEEAAVIRRGRVLLTASDLGRLDDVTDSAAPVPPWAVAAEESWGFVGVADTADGRLASFLLLSPGADVGPDHPGAGRFRVDGKAAAVVALQIDLAAGPSSGRLLLEAAIAHLRRVRPRLRWLEAVASEDPDDHRLIPLTLAEQAGFVIAHPAPPPLCRLDLGATVPRRTLDGLRRRARDLLPYPLPRPQTGLPSASKVTSVG